MARRHAGLIAVSLALAACQKAAPPAELSPADRAALQATIDSALAIANTPPFNATAYVHQYYADDAILMPPNEPARTGMASVEEWFKALPNVSAVAFKTEDMQGAPHLTYVRGRYTFTVTPPGSAPVVDSGKFLEIWRRQANGAWRSQIDAFNSDLPATPPPPAPAK